MHAIKKKQEGGHPAFFLYFCFIFLLSGNTGKVFLPAVSNPIKPFELNENMDRINNFLSGITGIEDQTNLSTLYASIEAARAGEGFTASCRKLKIPVSVFRI